MHYAADTMATTRKSPPPPKRAGRKPQLPEGSISKGVKLPPDVFHFLYERAHGAHKQTAVLMREILVEWVEQQKQASGEDKPPRRRK
jgi:hypothetical protein